MTGSAVKSSVCGYSVGFCVNRIMIFSSECIIKRYCGRDGERCEPDRLHQVRPGLI